MKENIYHNRRFHVLDSFRGLAALGVVMFHIHTVKGVSTLDFFRNANLFVEFFFILSGFVMYHAYQHKKVSLIEFVSSRFRRIYPLHIFALAIVIFLEFAKLFASHQGFNFNIEPFTGRNSPFELLGNIFLIQSWSPYFDSLSFNSPSWSISVEFYLYIILFILLKLEKQLLAFLLLFVLGCFFYLYDIIPAEVSKGIYGFFLGAIIYNLSSRVEVRYGAYFFWSACEILLLGTLIISMSLKVTSVFLGVIAPINFCFIVLVYSYEKGVISHFLSKSLFRNLGSLSYSIYLMHYIVIYILISIILLLSKYYGLSLTTMINGERTINTGSIKYDNLYISMIFLITIFVSHFTYNYIERQFFEKIKNKKDFGVIYYK